MSRDNTGKKQEDQQLQANQNQANQNYAQQNQELQGENAAISNLEANPGLGPEFMSSAKARNADVMDATFGGAADALERNSAATGHYADDTGLYPQEQQLASQKAIAENSQDMDYNLQDAQARQATKMALPGMYQAPATMLGGQATTLSGQNGSMISGRENVDNSPTFGQQMLLGGMQAAGQAAGAMAKACWIAEAIYGVNDERTHLLRHWLNTEFVKHKFGRAVMAFYVRFGQAIAAQVRKHSALKFVFQPLFELGLKKARKAQK